MAIKIKNKLIDKKVFIIAEAGVNHNGKIKIAKKLIDVAVKAKADAIKFQTFITEKLVCENTPTEKYQKNAKDETQFKMLSKLQLSNIDFYELNKYAKQKNIIFLSTPYDEQSADFLDSLNIVAFKIGSGEITHIPLLKYIAKKRKPIILSTGASTIMEVNTAINAIESMKNTQTILLHCTCDYPTKPKDVNLKAMLTLRIFGYPIGYSDHTLGNEASISAVSMGASVIERHITLDKNMNGPDHQASLNPTELNKFIVSIRKTELILGSSIKRPTTSEKDTLYLGRRSIVSSKYINQNDILTKEMIEIKRPGTGLAPKYFDDVIGKIAKRNIKKDTLIKLSMVE